MWWLVLLGCVSEPGEAARYARAVAGDLSLDEALALCDTLSEVEQQAGCSTDVLANKGALTPARCALLAEGTAWRDECWFMTSEDATLSAEERRRRCGESGRFMAWCYMHAWGAEVEAVVRHRPVAEELAAALVDIEQRWQDTAGATDPDYATRLHNDGWYRWQSRQRVLDPAVCDDLGPQSASCRRGTEVAIHRMLESAVRHDPARYRAVCRAGAVHASLPLMEDGPTLGEHPLAQAEAERLLKRWCTQGQLPPGSWAPKFGSVP